MHPFKKMILSMCIEEETITPNYSEVVISTVSDDLTGPDACANQLDISAIKYHSGELADPIVGDVIFNDPEGLSSFNGNSEFWKFDSFGIGFSSMKINTLGVVIEKQSC